MSNFNNEGKGKAASKVFKHLLIELTIVSVVILGIGLAFAFLPEDSEFVKNLVAIKSAFQSL